MRHGTWRAFLDWYTWLAEAACFWPGGKPPAEVHDCSSLVRFAYRNALARHDGEWARSIGLRELPPYADPPRGGAPLLRTGPEEEAHFADAAHLLRFNFERIANDPAAAQPGDALFWNQAAGQGAGHVMVWLGASKIESAAGPFVVYHTGPEGHWPGEVRRPSLNELLRHPEPRWRPLRGNPHFLGIYRWKLLLGGV